MPTTGSEAARVIARTADRATPSLTGLLRHVESLPHSSRAANRAIDLFAAEYARAVEESAPFLSVVLRTQGRRPETLKDALLCLEGQTSEDFEVCVVCHSPTDDDFRGVEEIVESQPASFRGRITVLRVDGGRRARPLNAAVETTRGRYLAFFDDDDLVFAHWVERFEMGARRSPGKLIRAMVASQHARPEMWPQDQDGFRHVTWPEAEYPAHFDQIAHLRRNYSPFMGWAFPRQLFSVLGLRFDEELYVCEDWDVILQGSLLCGVEEVREITAIYRRWDGIESSYTAHGAAQWEASQARVIAKLDEYPTLIPPGGVSEMRALLAERDELVHLRAIHHALLTSRGHRYAAPVREAMRFADFGRRAARVVARRLRRSGER